MSRQCRYTDTDLLAAVRELETRDGHATYDGLIRHLRGRYGAVSYATTTRVVYRLRDAGALRVVVPNGRQPARITLATPTT